jgi:hypothetical protein
MTETDRTPHLFSVLSRQDSPTRVRRRRITAVGVAGVLALALLATPGLAQEEAAEPAKTEVSEAYSKAMRAYLESQGSSPQIGQGIAYQVANETLMMIANSGAQVTEQMQTIVLEEALATYQTKFSDLDFLTALWAPVYARHFSIEELESITAWFQSELGRKVVALTPTLNEEGMAEVQKASIAMAPEFQLAVDARLREAGLVSDAPELP